MLCKKTFGFSIKRTIKTLFRHIQPQIYTLNSIGKTYSVIRNNNADSLNYFCLLIKTQVIFKAYIVYKIKNMFTINNNWSNNLNVCTTIEPCLKLACKLKIFGARCVLSDKQPCKFWEVFSLLKNLNFNLNLATRQDSVS